MEGENDRDAQIRDMMVIMVVQLDFAARTSEVVDVDHVSVVGFQSLSKEKIVLVPIAA